MCGSQTRTYNDKEIVLRLDILQFNSLFYILIQTTINKQKKRK